MRRVSGRFSAEVEKHASRRNRSFVGQCDHILEVYELVIKNFRHDELGTLAEQLQQSKK
jgi:hypothetical protein